MALVRTVHADATRETTKYVFWKSNVIEAAHVTVDQAKPYADKLKLWFETGEPVWMAAESLAFIVKQRALGERAMGSEMLSMRRAIDKRSGYGWARRSSVKHSLRHRYGQARDPAFNRWCGAIEMALVRWMETVHHTSYWTARDVAQDVVARAKGLRALYKRGLTPSQAASELAARLPQS